ncbi:hypothetical protein GGQ84_003073 [Desulfitispora alkaliphila]|uniref:ATP-binding protein n=1 Tax=Desulfitispora alkaliphila TaxID=622674 RepID=UPI003D22FEC9
MKNTTNITNAYWACKQLAIFMDLRNDKIFKLYENLLANISSHDKDTVKAVEDYCSLANRLFSLYITTEYNVITTKDLWQHHLMKLLTQSENPFSLNSSKLCFEELDFSLIKQTKRELDLLQQIYRCSGHVLQQEIESNSQYPLSLPSLGADSIDADNNTIYTKLSTTSRWSDVVDELANYYGTWGTGIMNLYPAFRWTKDTSGKPNLYPISHPDPITLDSLVGYERQREVVFNNTLKFIQGYTANNVLLYGDRGTGKSSTVKALLHEFKSRGLRLVELSKSNLPTLPYLLQELTKYPQKFIIFIDDLSFEDGEVDYKEMKAVLEGGLEVRPDNVLLYATSNRRHLIKERFADRTREFNSDDVRASDTVQEKLSLADRFGITVVYPSPTQKEYLKIVDGLAADAKLKISKEHLHHLALQWELRHNGRSGRTARQFIDNLCGEHLLNKSTI